MKIPFYSLAETHEPLKQQMLEAASGIIDSGGFIGGKNLSSFEKKFAAFCGAKFCIGTSNGLDALKTCLRVLNIGQGDEVIVPAHTFIATWLAVTETGATIIPVDADEHSFNIDIAKIEQAITSKTKAIMPVHLYGMPCNMEGIMAIAKKHNLFVIEDFAQAHGAAVNGQPTGSFGAINGVSLYPAKNLGGLGDAGAITTNSEELAAKARSIINYGAPVKYIHNEQGYNARLDELQAAFLDIKLPHLTIWNERRKEIVNRYRTNLSQIAHVKMQQVLNNSSPAYHLAVIAVERRDELQKYLADNGIQTIIHYPIPPHLQKAYEGLGFKQGDFPVAEKLSNSVLSLPLYIGLIDEMVDEVCAQVIAFYK